MFELRSMTQPYKTAVRKLKARWPRLCIFYSHCGHRHWDSTFLLPLCLLLSLLLFSHKLFERCEPKMWIGIFFIAKFLSLLYPDPRLGFNNGKGCAVWFLSLPLPRRKWDHCKHHIWIILGVNPQKHSEQRVNWVLGCQWCHRNSTEIPMDLHSWVWSFRIKPPEKYYSEGIFPILIKNQNRQWLIISWKAEYTS